MWLKGEWVAVIFSNVIEHETRQNQQDVVLYLWTKLDELGIINEWGEWVVGEVVLMRLLLVERLLWVDLIEGMGVLSLSAGWTGEELM